MLAGERRLLEQRGRRGTADANVAGVGRRPGPASRPARSRCNGEHRGQRPQRRDGAAARVGRSRSDGAGTRLAPRRSARRRRPTAEPSANAPPTEGEICVVRAVAAGHGEDQHQQRERERGERRPPEPDQRRRTLGAMELAARHQRNRAERDGRRTIGWMRREPPIRSPGSTIAVSNVPTACRNVSVISPTPAPARPRIDASGVMIAISSPRRGRSRRRRRGDRGGDDPGQRQPLQQLAGLRVDPPDPLGDRRLWSRPDSPPAERRTSGRISRAC